jgi:rifampin ADP-ribosylating transferase
MERNRHDDLDVYVPVTVENSEGVSGPFFHGTKALLHVGDDLVPGYASNFQQSRVSQNIYFATRLETAVWGAELASALSASGEAGHVYLVEPLGPFEDDPNVTNKRAAGNPTGSYRSRHAVRVVSQVTDWQPHAPEVLQGMLDSLALLRQEGRDLIED